MKKKKSKASGNKTVKTYTRRKKTISQRFPALNGIDAIIDEMVEAGAYSDDMGLYEICDWNIRNCKEKAICPRILG